ncbi:aldolase/citrate lyase family protein [Ornithinimicrobium sediminis]|uniref:aldolase/citrate lyase family protein n=1 Tax=Ornithinimicrobium sediminis TaxID=2904603 RepID=UPI001E518C95|nr:aldolase/citrate lyase family protein [Ornithinimicrobium sediminis]MCE0486624.1 aldolase/citrate lyase family protein [Ornithinimicrobium sediminis]
MDATTPLHPPAALRGAADAGLLDERVTQVLAELHRTAEPQRQELLRARKDLAHRVTTGAELGQDPVTRDLREDGSWQVAAPPRDLQRRSVELAGAATADMAAVARTSGADVWVADLEDALVPTWERLTAAHRTLTDWVQDPAGDLPTLVVRPRGLHLDEAHLLVDGAPVAAPVADTTLFLAHQAAALLERGSGPYLYLPKIETHAEAQWWDSMLAHAEELLGLAHGTVRVSVLIETVHAAYQMEEILHALRGRVTALTAGRYDYVFSHLRTYARRADHILPDRDSFTMSTRFLRAYTDILVHTCHRRGAHAIGGPVAEVPGGTLDDSTLQVQARVSREKVREARQGFDGAWVLHPALVPVARAAFATVQRGAAGSARPRPDSPAVVDPQVLSDISMLPGTPTLSGLRTNIRVSLRYLTSWLSGQGTLEIDGHLEDFGTVELARLQVWQWSHHEVQLAEGPTVGPLLLGRVLEEEIAILTRRLPAAGRHITLAADLLRETIGPDEPPAFISHRAYAVLLGLEGEPGAETAA